MSGFTFFIVYIYKNYMSCNLLSLISVSNVNVKCFFPHLVIFNKLARGEAGGGGLIMNESIDYSKNYSSSKMQW